MHFYNRLLSVTLYILVDFCKKLTASILSVEENCVVWQESKYTRFHVVAPLKAITFIETFVGVLSLSYM